MDKVALIAKITAQPGKRDEMVDALRVGLTTVDGEPGTLVYQMHLDANDGDVVWFYEVYADQAALAAHGSSEAMRAMGKASAAFAAGRPELTFLTPLGGKGL